MPLAFDLISTLVSGWILPVATTDRARSPFSTAASLDGSMGLPPLRAATRPRTARTATATVANAIQRRFFFRPLPFPFAMLVSNTLNGATRPPLHLSLRTRARPGFTQVDGYD